MTVYHAEYEYTSDLGAAGAPETRFLGLFADIDDAIAVVNDEIDGRSVKRKGVWSPDGWESLCFDAGNGSQWKVTSRKVQ